MGFRYLEMMHYQGQTVARDTRKVKQYFAISSKDGNAQSTYMLGLLELEAANEQNGSLIEQATSEGNPLAQNYLDLKKPN